jgi:hypothetical protein
MNLLQLHMDSWYLLKKKWAYEGFADSKSLHLCREPTSYFIVFAHFTGGGGYTQREGILEWPLPLV